MNDQFFCTRCGTRSRDAGTCDRDGTKLSAVISGSLLGTEVGNYVLVEELGQGGMGSVYRAVQPAIGAEMAIKVLHTTVAQRLVLEAQAVNRVRHPNLLRILDIGFLTDRRPYLVMELLDGLSLADAVGKLAPALACYVAAEALDALAAVHAEGIVHRDLKPANIFLARDGRVVVLDFGIAKLVTAEVPAAHSSGIIGTPDYMAPEQIRSEPVDPRTDVYAMGILLYETITGRRPFAAAVTFDMLVQHLDRRPPPPADLVPGLAPAISDAILRALEKAPARRFQTAGEMASALRLASGSTGRHEVAAYVSAHANRPTPVPLRTPIALDSTHAAEPTRRERVPRRPADDRDARAETLPESKRVDRAVAPIRRTMPWLVVVVVVAGGLIALRHAGSDRAAPAPPPTPPITPGSATPPVVVVAPRPDAATTGTLELKSDPAGAAISLDHVARGVTPISLSVDAGAHLVHAELTGYLAIDEAADVRGGERTSVVLRLPRDVQARSKPPAPGTTTSPPSSSETKPGHGETGLDRSHRDRLHEVALPAKASTDDQVKNIAMTYVDDPAGALPKLDQILVADPTNMFARRLATIAACELNYTQQQEGGTPEQRARSEALARSYADKLTPRDRWLAFVGCDRSGIRLEGDIERSGKIEHIGPKPP